MITKRLIQAAAFVCAFSFFLTSTVSSASAFQLWEEGGGIGDYHAGGAAIADNVSTDFYNPAGITRLDRPEISLGGVLIDTNINYKGNLTVTLFGSQTYQNIDAQGGDKNYIPNFHIAVPFAQYWVADLNVTTPLGLDTNYGTDTAIQYVATESKISAVNINPNLSLKLNDHFSIGAGFDAERLNAIFNDVDDIGGTSYPLENKLSSWDYGFNMGALYQFTPSTRLGLSYRSEIVHHTNGNSTVNDLFGQPTTTAITSDLIFPATTMLSFYQAINFHWAWMASATYSQWDAFQTLAIYNVNTPLTPTNVFVPQHFRNSWNLALGGRYTINPKWQLEAGVGFDESPVVTDYRTVQVPDNNRYAVSVGFHYKPVQRFDVEVGYDHFFIQKADIHAPMTVSLETLTPDGYVDSSANVFGVQLTYTF